MRRELARHRLCLFLLAAAGASCVAAPSLAQLRVATWNISAYNGTNREQAFQTAIYGSFQGRRMAPDVVLAQEVRTAAGLSAFRDLLNGAPGSPGDWAAAPFMPSPDGNAQAFFYRTSKVTFLGATLVSEGGNDPWHPRPLQRYDMRPMGYSAASTVLACYSTHMKAGSSGSDQSRRLVEAQVIRADAENLPAGWNFLLAGDFNIQSSFQQAFQWLVGAQINNNGRFFDPIGTPGVWNNNISFRFVHTQAPARTGGLDDRFDLILLSARLVDGRGFSYLGDASVAYSTTTWNDANHSYRVWGNDGTSFTQNITIQGNQMVGAVIAQALFDAANTDLAGGHLPVFLDLRVPPKVDSVLQIDFGDVEVGTTGAGAERVLTVSNSGDVSLWTMAGIAPLEYTLEATAGFSGPVPPAPGLIFTTGAGAPGGQHIITMDTSTVGPRQGTVSILSNAPDEPARVVMVMGNVVGGVCYANCDLSTIVPVLNVDDFSCFINEFAGAQGLPHAQQIVHYANCDGSTEAPVLNVDDFTCFINAFAAGCR